MTVFHEPTKARKRGAPGDGHDFYPTPLWAVLGFLDAYPLDGLVLDPGCGDGEMCRAFEMRGIPFVARDLVDRGFGEAGVDFLTSPPPAGVRTIMTNPPYKDAEAFVRRARSLALASATSVRVIMFMPLQFLQSGKRADGLWAQDPPDQVLIVPERVTMYPRGQERASSGTQASAWYVWRGGEPRPGDHTVVKWLPTGANRRYAAVTEIVRTELLAKHHARLAAAGVLERVAV